MSLDGLDNKSFNGAELKRTAHKACFGLTSLSKTLFSLGFYAFAFLFLLL